MARPKGSPNKITSIVKEKLHSVMNQVMDSIDVDSMTIDQKLKMFQIAAQYILPRLAANYNKEVQEDVPIFIEVLKRKEDLDEEDESEVWKDNFEVDSVTKVVPK